MNIERFFGEKGLSRSEASHLSNVATKRAEQLVKEIKQLKFINSSFILESFKYDLTRASEFNPALITSKINEIGFLYGFVAWIREALKAGALYVNQINTHDYYTEEEKEIKRIFRERISKINNKKNLVTSAITESDVMDAMGTKEFAEYLLNESLASHIGQLVHKDSFFEKALDSLIELEPTTFSRQGKLDLIISNSSSVSVEDLEKFIVGVRADHRESEKQVNRVKAITKDKVAASQQEFQAAIQLINNEYTNVDREFSNKIKEIDDAVTKRRLDAQVEFSKLKVIVPYMFDDLVKVLQSGK